jgi:hypothetical protein
MMGEPDLRAGRSKEGHSEGKGAILSGQLGRSAPTTSSTGALYTQCSKFFAQMANPQIFVNVAGNPRTPSQGFELETR